MEKIDLTIGRSLVVEADLSSGISASLLDSRIPNLVNSLSLDIASLKAKGIAQGLPDYTPVQVEGAAQIPAGYIKGLSAQSGELSYTRYNKAGERSIYICYIQEATFSLLAEDTSTMEGIINTLLLPYKLGAEDIDTIPEIHQVDRNMRKLESRGITTGSFTLFNSPLSYVLKTLIGALEVYRLNESIFSTVPVITFLQNPTQLNDNKFLGVDLTQFVELKYYDGTDPIADNVVMTATKNGVVYGGSTGITKITGKGQFDVAYKVSDTRFNPPKITEKTGMIVNLVEAIILSTTTVDLPVKKLILRQSTQSGSNMTVELVGSSLILAHSNPSGDIDNFSSQTVILFSDLPSQADMPNLTFKVEATTDLSGTPYVTTEEITLANPNVVVLNTAPVITLLGNASETVVVNPQIEAGDYAIKIVGLANGASQAAGLDVYVEGGSNILPTPISNVGVINTSSQGILTLVNQQFNLDTAAGGDCILSNNNSGGGYADECLITFTLDQGVDELWWSDVIFPFGSSLSEFFKKDAQGNYTISLGVGVINPADTSGFGGRKFVGAYIDQGVTASDAQDGNLTSSIVTTIEKDSGISPTSIEETSGTVTTVNGTTSIAPTNTNSGSASPKARYELEPYTVGSGYTLDFVFDRGAALAYYNGEGATSICFETKSPVVSITHNWHQGRPESISFIDNVPGIPN